MNRVASACGFVALLGGLGSSAQAQQGVTLGSEFDRYLRVLELEGAILFAPAVFHSASSLSRAFARPGGRAHPWESRFPLTGARPAPTRPEVVVLRPEIETIFNSAYPRGDNDGPLWAGRGLSGTLAGGVAFRWRYLTATLRPTLWYAQNRAFPLAPVPYPNRSPFAYQWQRNIDWPQRFGSAALTEFDWGQSGVRLDAGNLTAGWSTENLWWGPGFRNAIALTNAGPGFPHLDLGTGRPVRTPIGHVEIRAVWGGLAESAYFDTIPGNGRRFFTGLSLGYRPPMLPGLTLGLTRTFYRNWPVGSLALEDVFDFVGEIFRPATRLPSGALVNDSTDQLASLVARWVLPESGFEAYVEWGRGDFSERLRDLLVEPDHSRGYTVGFQKLLRSGAGRVRIAGEHTTLGASATSQVRGLHTFYIHNQMTQGYTHRGQILGAAIGPGGQSQFLGVDRYTAAGRWGLSLQRVRFDDDAYYRLFGGTQDFHSHQVEYTLRASAYRFLGKVDLGIAAELSRQLNRYFQFRQDVTNLQARTTLVWR